MMKDALGLIPAGRRSPSVADPRLHAHLVGAGGAGMHSLMHILLQAGWRVSASDLSAHGGDRAVESSRLTRHVGHAAEHVPPETRVLIYSDAIGSDNVERLAAAARRIPQLSYPQMLGRLIAGRTGLAVAGTHGKSTTTAMAAAILVQAGLDPTVVCGAVPCDAASGGRLGQGDIALVEACEYRRNFLHLAPRAAVVTGIEHDHFDCFPTPAHVQDAFGRFVESLPGDGVLVVNGHCRTALEVACRAGCPVVTYGDDSQAQWRAERLWSTGQTSHFRLLCNRTHVTDVTLRVPGRHNVNNALAAAALTAQLDADAGSIAAALGGFAGMRRRMEPVGWWHGMLWWDDYAHHPTEVRAALQAIRHIAPQRRIGCVFQPHQASRTRQLLDELAESLHNADRVAVADVFPARETADGSHPLLARELARRVRGSGVDVAQVHSLPEIADWLRAGGAAGDVCLTLGAGDIRKVWDGFIYGIRTLRAAG